MKKRKDQRTAVGIFFIPMAPDKTRSPGRSTCHSFWLEVRKRSQNNALEFFLATRENGYQEPRLLCLSEREICACSRIKGSRRSAMCWAYTRDPLSVTWIAS